MVVYGNFSGPELGPANPNIHTKEHMLSMRMQPPTNAAKFMIYLMYRGVQTAKLDRGTVVVVPTNCFTDIVCMSNDPGYPELIRTVICNENEMDRDSWIDHHSFEDTLEYIHIVNGV